eukprot:4365301-Pleurochrysis_carterae.AAC.1
MHVEEVKVYVADVEATPSRSEAGVSPWKPPLPKLRRQMRAARACAARARAALRVRALRVRALRCACVRCACVRALRVRALRCACVRALR